MAIIRSPRDNITLRLKKLSGIEDVGKIKIEREIIQRITLKTNALGELVISRLRTNDSESLFTFYFQRLSEQARNFFPPYPLFSPRPENASELKKKIERWKKEKDWTVLKLLKEKQIIGICLLKRYASHRPTSGLAVSEQYQKMGLGLLLQTLIDEQARLLGIKRLVITLAKENIASLKLHQKAGFKKTGKEVSHVTYIQGVKTIDRNDIEMVKDFTEEINT